MDISQSENCLMAKLYKDNGIYYLPVLNHPSLVNASVVASGFFQYPKHTEGPRTCKSPGSFSVSTYTTDNNKH